MTTKLIQWLLESDEPWTHYRTLVDLLDRAGEDADVRAARKAMLAHPQVKALAAEVAAWGEHPITRHNDAGHAIHKLSTLADFGVKASDRGINSLLKVVMAHQSPEGAFQSVVNISKSFGGTGEDTWAWMSCDAPTLLYSLIAMGLGSDPHVERAVNHLVGLVDENGWRCVVAPELGKFRGPGRKADPCPIANVYALKALAQVPELLDCSATRTGTDMLLQHWQYQKTIKFYMFGVGTDFRKLKYPFVWYDILHVADVLSRFAFVHADRRFQQMLKTITAQADSQGRYTATSMYQAWKGWSFADKNIPSTWLTFLVLRILKRVDIPDRRT
jgi:hypothetical protein